MRTRASGARGRRGAGPSEFGRAEESISPGGERHAMAASGRDRPLNSASGNLQLGASCRLFRGAGDRQRARRRAAAECGENVEGPRQDSLSCDSAQIDLVRRSRESEREGVVWSPLEMLVGPRGTEDSINQGGLLAERSAPQSQLHASGIGRGFDTSDLSASFSNLRGKYAAWRGERLRASVTLRAKTPGASSDVRGRGGTPAPRREGWARQRTQYDMRSASCGDLRACLAPARGELTMPPGTGRHVLRSGDRATAPAAGPRLPGQQMRASTRT